LVVFLGRAGDGGKKNKTPWPPRPLRGGGGGPILLRLETGPPLPGRGPHKGAIALGPKVGNFCHPPKKTGATAGRVHPGPTIPHVDV